MDKLNSNYPWNRQADDSGVITKHDAAKALEKEAEEKEKLSVFDDSIGMGIDLLDEANKLLLEKKVKHMMVKMEIEEVRKAVGEVLSKNRGGSYNRGVREIHKANKYEADLRKKQVEAFMELMTAKQEKRMKLVDIMQDKDKRSKLQVQLSTTQTRESQGGGIMEEFLPSQVVITSKDVMPYTFGVVRQAKIPGRPAFVKVFTKPISEEAFKAYYNLLRNLRHEENLLRYLGSSKQLVGPLVHDMWKLPGEVVLPPAFALFFEVPKLGSLHSAIYNTKIQFKPNSITSIAIARQIAQGMAFLHSQDPPILHLDLNLKNIFLESESQNSTQIRIGNFGFQTLFPTEEEMILTLATKGSLFYMAPELLPDDPFFKPRDKISKKCDVYSYGILLNELVTMKPPYETAEEVYDFAAKIKGRKDRPECGTWQHSSLVQKCWDADPRNRDDFQNIHKIFSRQ